MLYIVPLLIETSTHECATYSISVFYATMQPKRCVVRNEKVEFITVLQTDVSGNVAVNSTMKQNQIDQNGKSQSFAPVIEANKCVRGKFGIPHSSLFRHIHDLCKSLQKCEIQPYLTKIACALNFILCQNMFLITMQFKFFPK